MSKHVWGYWDCDCGRKHIRGDKTDCPGCGKPRNENTEFYMDSNNIEYVNTSEENDEPDWICGFCGSENSSKLDYCARCGANKNDNNGDYFDYHSNDSNDDLKNSETDYTDDLNQSPSDYNCIETPENKQTSNYADNKPCDNKLIKNPLIQLTAKIPMQTKQQIGIATLVIAAITAIVFFCVWLFTPIEHHMTIEGFEWSRNIEIEELRTFNESGWSLPNEARLQYTRNEIHHYEDVFDHYETKSKQVPHESIVGYEEHTSYRNLGNGQFEEVVTRIPQYETYYETEYYESAVYRQEPRYATKYYYEIDRWTHSYNVTTSSYDKEPYWGTYSLGTKERKGKSSEIYYIIGYENDKERKFSISFAEWNAYEKGNKISFTTHRFNNEILEIKT